MNRQSRVISAVVAAALLAAAGGVRADGVQFSADMERRTADGQTQKGRMYVGDGRTRMETSLSGQETVRISDSKNGKEYLLFPSDKTYLERGTPSGGAAGAAAGAAPPSPTAETDPCAGVPGLTCKRVGKEAVNGREAVKWEMTMTDQGRTMTATQWLDVQRPGMPLKQVMPNGQTMELKMVGTETVGGRKTEQWEMTQTLPNQPPATSRQWYDPELKLTVREKFPGGYISELKNIQVGSQPDALFAVPAGYTKKVLPAPPQSAAPPGAPPAGVPPQPGR